jgi:hypothetical protein
MAAVPLGQAENVGVLGGTTDAGTNVKFLGPIVADTSITLKTGARSV